VRKDGGQEYEIKGRAHHKKHESQVHFLRWGFVGTICNVDMPKREVRIATSVMTLDHLIANFDTSKPS